MYGDYADKGTHRRADGFEVAVCQSLTAKENTMKSTIYVLRHLLFVLLCVLVFALPQIAMADPPRPRRTYALSNIQCMIDTSSGFYWWPVKAYTTMTYLGTSSNGYWYRVVATSGYIPLRCPASQMKRPTTGR